MLNDILYYLGIAISFLGNLSLFLIAVITFYKTTYCKKMRLTALYTHAGKDDGMIRTFKIISRSLVGLVITNVEWVINDTWKITLLKDDVDTPIELPAMGMCNISTKPYSAIKEDNELSEAFHNKKWYLLITLSDGTAKKVKWRYKNFLFRRYNTRIRNKVFMLKSPSVITYYHKPSDLLITPYIKYVVNMKTENNSCWFKIYRSGVMSETIGGYNGLPESTLHDKPIVLATLQELNANAEYFIEEIDESIFSDYVDYPLEEAISEDLEPIK